MVGGTGIEPVTALPLMDFGQKSRNKERGVINCIAHAQRPNRFTHIDSLNVDLVKARHLTSGCRQPGWNRSSYPSTAYPNRILFCAVVHGVSPSAALLLRGAANVSELSKVHGSSGRNGPGLDGRDIT